MEIIKTAILSPEKLYRYVLSRVWDDAKEIVNFIGLNPSIADDTIDDPTIRRCVAFAKSWGYGGLYMTNLFAYRATDFANLLKAEKEGKDPVGHENDKWIKSVANQADKVVFVWGTKGVHNNRDKKVIDMFENRYCIKLSKNGEHPRHPLYLKSNLTPIKF